MATIQLTFYINLTDQAQVAALQAQYPNGISRGPLPAATEFSAPYQAEGTPFSSPCTRTGWMPPGASGKFPLDRAFFTINDGWFGHLFGRDQKYAWIGQFVYSPATNATVLVDGALVTPGALCEVAFAVGFEAMSVNSSNAEGFTTFGQTSGQMTRDAGRTLDGVGRGIRGAGNDEILHNVFGAVMGTRGWERFYFRIRTLPTGDYGLWRMKWDGNIGLAIQLNSSGALQVRHVGPTSVFEALIGQTDPMPLNEWLKLDVLYNNQTTVESVRLFVNGVEVLNVEDRAHGEISSNRTPDSSTIFGTASLGGEVDVDDWVAFNPPAATVAGHNELWNASVTPGADWANGHHIVYAGPKAYDATHNAAAWGTGDVRGLDQRWMGANAVDVLTSTTSGALVAANTRADLAVQMDRSMGWQAIVVSVCMRRATGGTPQLGYSYTETTGGAVTTVMANVNNPGTTNLWSAVAARPTGITTPKQLASLMLRFTKAADANSTQVTALMGTILLVGTFDQCDVPPQLDPEAAIPVIPDPLRGGTHNAPYPRTPWARSEVPPDSPVWIKSGTYAGNNLGQDVIAKIPAHFWWVRRTDSNTGAGRWFSSMLSSKRSIVGEPRDSAGVWEEDPEFVSPGGDTDSETRSRGRIAGSNAAENATGGTYQYLAIGDPGMRFMLNGHAKHEAAVASADNALADPDFLPEWGWFVTETPSAANGNFFQKGPGHAAPNGNDLDVAESSTIARFAAGVLTSLATLHPSGTPLLNYSLWRNRDGADYDALELDEPVVVQIFHITGDGAASRTIQLPRTSGKRPLWAFGQAVNSTTSVVRDPSHTTNTSSAPASGSTTITTGFTAGGIDSITVGSTLNPSGVVVNFFVVMGDATAGNAGWGGNTEVLVDPVPAPGGQWEDGYTQDELDELENPTTPPEVDSFDDGPDLVDDLADALCVPFTIRAVNLAFSRIGITDMLTAASDLLTPTSQERTLAAQFYEHVLRFVLRDFPWAHATRYAALVLVDGSISDPTNADWVYAFRAPTGCLFVRRIIRPELGRKHDPKPPAFRMVVDDVGPLVYVTDDGVQFDSTDEPFIEIEYTVRPACGAKAGGDQKFVSAFAYRLGWELACSLSRDEKIIARMDRGYLAEKHGAATTVSNEQQQQPPGDPDWLLGR